MNNEAKYYTPKIEEFHVGFEYEVNSDYNDNWKPKTVKDFGDLYDAWDGLSFEGHLEAGHIRVKFLDREDIEAEGWIPYTLGNKRHFVLGEFHLYFLPNEEEPENSLVIICDATGVNVNIAENAHKLFCGTVKNRSKLNEVMKRQEYQILKQSKLINHEKPTIIHHITLRIVFLRQEIRVTSSCQDRKQNDSTRTASLARAILSKNAE